ncbi:MAG: carbohydrate ABC transporter permease [Propionibacteriaceae bacterium]|nr:carbohydrate ABC transporter permease [Propionibacteriaceae bacterium]
MILIVICLLQIIPFYLGLTTSMKGSRDTSSPWSLPLATFTLENFAIAWKQGNIGRAILNSAVITVATTAITVIVGALAAYPLARRRTRGNQAVLLLALAVMMIPPLSILVPLIRMLNDMSLLNTFPGLILPLAALSLPQAIFLYAQSLRGIPIDIEEAARIDGAGSLRVFFQIVLPVLKPVTISVVILTGVNKWNEFALSNYIMTTDATRPLAPAVATFFGSAGANVNAAIAGAIMGVLPVLVAYLFLQKYFMKGALAGAVK